MKHRVYTFLKWPFWIQFHNDITIGPNDPWFIHSSHAVWFGRLSISAHRMEGWK